MNFKTKIIYSIFCIFVVLAVAYIVFFNYTDSSTALETITLRAGTFLCKFSILCVFYFFSLAVSYYLNIRIELKKEKSVLS
ncbi:hypothetical protein DRH27_00195 [Candidatus Falkowbacteria bacterium]|nr:MAG: hypothetical protein DRH27_00195 [Candidatus Falkowbacteria bacterium]